MMARSVHKGTKIDDALWKGHLAFGFWAVVLRSNINICSTVYDFVSSSYTVVSAGLVHHETFRHIHCLD